MNRKRFEDIRATLNGSKVPHRTAMNIAFELLNAVSKYLEGREGKGRRTMTNVSALNTSTRENRTVTELQMPKTKLFDTDSLREHIDTSKDEFLGVGHYCLDFRLTFESEGKFYQVNYQSAAVEDQCDFDPFDGASEVECVEVEPYEATVTLYRKV